MVLVESNNITFRKNLQRPYNIIIMFEPNIQELKISKPFHTISWNYMPPNIDEQLSIFFNLTQEEIKKFHEFINKYNFGKNIKSDESHYKFDNK